MTNHFHDLHKKGITNTEMSMEELQQLYKDGKITESQFTKILIDNLGVVKFMEIIQDTMEEVYKKDLLTRPIPEGLKSLCEEP